MKKKLEADLISIAHRILKLKNKSEIVQLHQETQKLYEKLSVLRFLEENFADVKPTIGQAEIEEKLEATYSNPDNNIDEEPIHSVQSNIETVPEVTKEITIEAIPPTPLEPHSEMFKQEPVFETAEVKKEIQQISFEELLGGKHADPIFERVQKTEKAVEKEFFPDTEPAIFTKTEMAAAIQPEVVLEKTETKLEPKPISVNENLNKITFGLNDRIAFEKQLFGGNSEDMNRVVSQISTFDTFEEAQNFIEDMVKPDYHNWEGKDDYVIRFMDIVEKKFA